MAAMKAPCSLRQGQAMRDARRLSANLDLAARVAFSALRPEGKLWALSETQINLAKRNGNGLVKHIREVFRRSNLGPIAASMCGKKLPGRSMRSLIAIKRMARGKLRWLSNARRKKAFAAATSRLARKRKSTVFPLLSTAR